MNIMQKTIGERIKAAREAKGMSQEDLGKSFGATKQTIYKYETGIITNIPLDNLEKMASVLGVSSAYLAGWEDTPEFKSLCKVAEDMYKKEAIEKFVESFSEETQRFPGFPFVFNAFRILPFCVYLAVITSNL